MAKHAKPNLTSTLSRDGARGAAALAIASVGFLATAPAAFAGGDADGHDTKHGAHHESNDIDSHESQGIVNVADNDVLVPVQVCDNYVPVNVLGVQVPIEEVNLAVPILTEGDTEADSSETCQQAGGIGEDGEMRSAGGAGPAPATGSNDVAADTDTAADQGAGGESLGGTQDLIAEHAGSPADALGTGRSAGDLMGPVSQQRSPEQVVAPAGDLGAHGAPDAAQVEDLAPAGH